MELLFLLGTIPPEVWSGLASLLVALSVLITAYAGKKSLRKIADGQDEQKAVAVKAAVKATVAAVGTEENSAKLDEIHILVNGRLGAALERIKGLEAALAINSHDPVPPPADAV